MHKTYSRSISTLAWLALMFLPALPAYLWVWPNISGRAEDAFQVLVYVYFIVAGLLIGLRFWTPAELGFVFTWRSFLPAAACGTFIVIGTALGLAATNLPIFPQPFNPARMLWQIFFYFVLVGFGEELLFRGDLFAALDERWGGRWAIIGSTLAFGFYHLSGVGWPGVFSGLIFGLLFGFIRRRTGSLLAAIYTHGLLDAVVVEMRPSRDIDMAAITIDQPWLLAVGYILMIGAVLALWKLYPARVNPDALSI